MDISIIVPLYRGKRYISNILNMVNENQRTLKEHGIQKSIEIILVNDYPLDNIDPILDCNNISIQLYENAQNFGIHKSRLRGLAKAKGIYILFLDQDDEISPSYLWRQLKYLEGADAVISNGIYRDNKIIYKGYEQQRQAVSKDNYMIKENTIVSPGQILIKKEAIPDLWGRYVLKENGSDDVLLWVLMLCGGKKFAVNPYIDYRHNEDGENASLNFIKMRRSVIELLDTIEKGKLLNDKDRIQFTKMSKRRIEKYESYIKLFENWDRILENITILFTKKIYMNIAIYGYGVVGKRLLQDLEVRDIKPVCVIDKAALSFRDVPYQICTPKNIPRNVDFIILTPVFAKKEIINILSKYASKIKSLNEFI